MQNDEIILYQTEDGTTKVEVRMEGETIWLTSNQLAELFQRDKSVVSRHIKNVFEEGELRMEGTVAKNATVRKYRMVDLGAFAAGSCCVFCNNCS